RKSPERYKLFPPQEKTSFPKTFSTITSPMRRECRPFPLAKQWMDTMRCLNLTAISSGWKVSFSIQYLESSNSIRNSVAIWYLSTPIFLLEFLNVPAHSHTPENILLCNSQIKTSDKISEVVNRLRRFSVQRIAS